MNYLNDQIAVVSGASGGIGGAIAAAFARQGATLCLLGRDATRLEACAETLRASSPRVDPHPCDLTRDSQIETLHSYILQQYGRVDILVHCAGAIDHGKLADVPVSALDRLYQANVHGPMMLTQKLLPLLKKPRGQIVFINSSAWPYCKAQCRLFFRHTTCFKGADRYSPRRSQCRWYSRLEHLSRAHGDAAHPGFARHRGTSLPARILAPAR